jgi:hypothetical protein
MRNTLFATLAAAGIGFVGSPAAYAMPANPVGSLQAIDELDQASKVAFCFYIDGWNGPGLYDCGFRMRRGMGWHGERRGPVVGHGNFGRGNFGRGNVGRGGGGRFGGGAGRGHGGGKPG